MVGVFAREQVGGFVGACHLHLRDPRGALLALRESARTLGAGKEKHKSVVLGDVATALVLGGDPDGIAPSPRQVRAAILAYAAGDALGVPWEGKTPEEVDWEGLEELAARGEWPGAGPRTTPTSCWLSLGISPRPTGRSTSGSFLLDSRRPFQGCEGSARPPGQRGGALSRPASCRPARGAASAPPCGPCRSAGQPQWPPERNAVS